MDPDELIKLLRAQKETAEVALSQMGEIPTDRFQRHELLFKHQMYVTMRSMQSENQGSIRTCVTNESYPPSKVPASQLKPILLADLRLETHHRGRIIFLRPIAMAVRAVGVVNVVEDTSGAADRLSIYNTSLASNPQSIITKGQVYAIKEPYYKSSMDGGYSLRVDHPSDFMLLPDNHVLMPEEFAPRLVELHSALSYKKQGNARYKAKTYQLAIDSYSRGIEACTSADQDLRADFYRNRAQANLLLGRFEYALSDAKRSIEHLSSGVNTASLNCKAYYRAGRALYALRRFTEAQAMYERALACSSSDSDSLQALDEVKRRIVEATTGVYDMQAIIDVNRLRPRRMNLASYVKGVTVGPAGKRGRGLFAAKYFKTGDTIMCEKAFDIGLSAEQDAAFHLIIDVNTGRDLTDTESSLFYSLVEQLRYNSLLARQFLDLHSGGYMPRYNACEVDGHTVIDTFEVLRIIQANSFGTDTFKHHEHPDGIGVWLTASYMNHTCNENASRFFLGDMIFVKAARDIEKGEEICTSYIPMVTDYEGTQKSLQNTWNFTCSCAVCTVESQTTVAQRGSRHARFCQLTALMRSNPHRQQETVDRRIIRQAETLYARLAETYDTALFKDSPRMDLVLPSFWIARCHITRGDIVRTKSACLEVLRNCGIFLTIRNNKATIERKHGVVSQMELVVDSAVQLMTIYLVEGKIDIGAQLRSFSHTMWLLVYPTLEGFVKRYSVE